MIWYQIPFPNHITLSICNMSSTPADVIFEVSPYAEFTVWGILDSPQISDTLGCYIQILVSISLEI